MLKMYVLLSYAQNNETVIIFATMWFFFSLMLSELRSSLLSTLAYVCYCSIIITSGNDIFYDDTHYETSWMTALRMTLAIKVAL